MPSPLHPDGGEGGSENSNLSLYQIFEKCVFDRKCLRGTCDGKNIVNKYEELYIKTNSKSGLY